MQLVHVAEEESLDLPVVVIVVIHLGVVEGRDAPLTQPVLLVVELHILRVGEWELEQGLLHDVLSVFK